MVETGVLAIWAEQMNWTDQLERNQMYQSEEVSMVLLFTLYAVVDSFQAEGGFVYFWLHTQLAETEFVMIM